MSILTTIAKIPRNQSASMMYIADQVSRGYSMHINGIVSSEKAIDFANKMDKKFDVNLTTIQRAIRKRKGIPNFILIMFPVTEEKFIWYILAAGMPQEIEKIGSKYDEHFFSALEKESRIELKDYELKRVIKSRKAGGGVRWTWFIKVKVVRMIQEELFMATRGRSRYKLEQAVERLRNRPMFSGVRNQVSIMLLKVGLEFKKRSGNKEKPDFLTKVLPFFGKKIKIFD